MEISPRCLVSFLSFLLLCGFAFSIQISHDLLKPHHDHGRSRSLLQAKTTCKEDFANKNYTIITSKCKGPNYPAKACCDAFKEFACPFAEAISDEKTECASTMFSYINLYGRYPPGIFANMCKEGKEGLDCSQVAAATSSSRALVPCTSTHTLLIPVFLFWFF